MHRLSRTARVAAATASLTLLSALGAHAQTVLVQVVGADDSQPLVGAVAHLVSPSGTVLNSRLADRAGRVLFTGLEPGRYAVRAEMLGRSTEESAEFSVLAGASVPLTLRLPSRAIELAGVEVTAEAGPCETRPSQEGRVLAEVWEEARKALSAAAVTDQQGIYRYSLVMFEQDLDEDRAVIAEDQTNQRGYMRTPFASHAVEELTEEGFVRRSASEWTYFAPDAETLLSDPFLDTHCFRLIEGGADRPDLVGLSFEPTGQNEGVPDISGTLWLDRDTVALRWVEFTYENLEPDVRPGDATGRVDFQRMPEGAWIVPEWSILMPLVDVDVGRSDRRRRIRGWHRTGGRVQEMFEAGGANLARDATTGSIEGIVVDSLGMPIQGARVGFVGSNQSIFTNAEGRFDLVGLMEGTYRIRFVDPALEALGLGAPDITREVAGGVASHVEFLMPSPVELLAATCGDETEAGMSVLAGVVRDATTDAPIPGAGVRARWSHIELNSAVSGVVGREVFTEHQTTADDNGLYVFCSVPRRDEIRVTVSVGDVDGGTSALAISGEEEARMLVIRYESRGASAREPDAETPPEVDRQATGSTRFGQIRDAGTGEGLEGALVEFLELGLAFPSDADGGVRVEGLPPGTSSVRVQRLGYRPVVATLEAGGQAFTVLVEPMETVDADERSAVVGRVLDEHGQPVSEVDVYIAGRPADRVLSNREGRFRFPSLEPGLLEVRFERLGHEARTAHLVVQRGQTAELSVVMPTEAIELEPISVTVRSRALERSGFYERRQQGFGHHFDRPAIERIQPEILFDLVRRAPGVRSPTPVAPTPPAAAPPLAPRRTPSTPAGPR